MDIQEEIKIFRNTFKIPRWKISEDTGISESSLRYYENGTRTPSITKWNQLKKYMVNYTVSVSSLKPTGSVPDQNNKEKNEMNFIMKLAEDKINDQEIEIARLNSIIEEYHNAKEQPLWDDIGYDVQTKQAYKKGRYDKFEKYEMVFYQDFFKYLGYTESEAEEYWKVHHKFMTSPVEQRGTDYNLIDKMGFKINKDKTNASIMDPKQTRRHFEMALRNNIVNQLQIYNACYIKKDGTELLAIVSVLFDFTTNSSKSKIKFIDS